LRNALAHGIPEYRKWHTGVPRHPDGNHCSTASWPHLQPTAISA